MEDSKAFFKRKIDFLTKQIEKIQPVLQEKHAMKQGESATFSIAASFFITSFHLMYYTASTYSMLQKFCYVLQL